MNDSEFDDLLKTAGANVPLPQSFNQGVWHRIESRASAAPPIASFPGYPWLAGLGVAATIVMGLWLGALSTSRPKDVKIAYAESISPFAHGGEK